MSKTQTTAILSGNFTGNKNFSGYNASGNRVHIPARQMENLGWSENKDVQFPFFAIITEREFSVLDANGQPTAEKFTRTQAGSIFASKEDLLSAVNADKLLAIEAEQDLRKQASSAGLTETAINSLLSVAI